MNTLLKLNYPLAITMWDFSWLERRWAGAGYENWDEALDALKLRGYDAVRIDAYPHLLAHDPRRVWELPPLWTQQMWGAPSLCRVQVMPALLQFLEKCAERNMRVGLSTWFRADVDNIRLRVRTPQDIAAIWIATLDVVKAAGLLDTLLYVDLCNEFPLRVWIPGLYDLPDTPDFSPADDISRRWMNEALALVRAAYPTLPLCFSLTNDLDHCSAFDVAAHDVLEIHIWMVQASDFYQRVGYKYDLFSPTSYDNLALNGAMLYSERPEHWNAALTNRIHQIAAWAGSQGKPLITTECWGVVDYKDAPLLDWEWVKNLCALGVKTAVSTGQWAAIATSNFCGPQFVGMWRDVAWHLQLTNMIHNASLP